MFCKKRSEACNFIKKQTLAQMFSCEFCEISKKTFLHRTPLVAASEICKEKDIYESMINFGNNKSPGDDGLTKEFYQTFWQDVKDIFFNSSQESKQLKYLCTSQRQAIIKLLEKSNKDKRYASN